MVIINIILTLGAIAAMCVLICGSILLVQDSEKKHNISKELWKKYPNHSREQIKFLTRKRLEEANKREEK